MNKEQNDFECHITLDNPYSKVSIDELKSLGLICKWHTSKIDGDPLLGNKVYFYFTKHSTSYDELEREMNELINYLIDKHGVRPVRKKIEQVILDVRM